MEKIKDYLPLATLLLIIIGYTDITGYYFLFETRINSYLEFSELFQVQFAFYGLTISYAILIAGLAIPFFFLIDRSVRSKVVIRKYKWLQALKAELLNYRVIFLASIVMILIKGANSYGEYRAKKVISGISRQEAVFITDKDTIKTDKNIAYVGQTKNYIFFYNRKAKQTTVFKVSDAKKILLSEGIDHRKEK